MSTDYSADTIYKEQKDKLDEAEKKKEPFISQLSGLKSEEQRLVVSLKEQQNIYDENASKIFGAGAKKKKDAKQKMIEIENSLRSIKSQIYNVPISMDTKSF